jgi:hypothetical protein
MEMSKFLQMEEIHGLVSHTYLGNNNLSFRFEILTVMILIGLLCSEGCIGNSNMPILVVGTGGWNNINDDFKSQNTICGDKETCTLVPQGGLDTFNRVWKIGGGSIANGECGTVAGIPGLNFPPSSGAQITVADNEERWNRQWKVIAHEPVLMTENNGPYQEWKAHFTNPPYDFALLPGFPGYTKQVKLQFVQVKLQQTTGQYLHIMELQVFDSTGTNIALGKNATSSSQHPTYGDPQRAVDGNLTTMFHTNDGDANPWLNIDLGTSCRGCKIVIHNRNILTCKLSNANLMLYDGSGNVVKTINVGNTCERAILMYDLSISPEIAKTAMNRCDESMALLVGSQTSLGTLKAIADLVTSEGPGRMPGECCFDTPSTTENYLGVDVRQLLIAYCFACITEIYTNCCGFKVRSNIDGV